MYYEMHGTGAPLVLIHGGGSTIDTTFGRIIGKLSENHQVIAVELQAHGHTGDRGTPLSFEQDADDVATLRKNLGIAKAAIFGFSNGGTTALQIVIRHPEMVRKLIVASAIFKKEGAPEGLWAFIRNGTLDTMPQALKDAFKSIDPSDEALRTMFSRDQERMNTFQDIADEAIAGITAKTLIITGDQDVASIAHTVAMHELIAGSQLMVIPGGHGDYIGEITTLKAGDQSYLAALEFIEKFLLDGESTT